MITLPNFYFDPFNNHRFLEIRLLMFKIASKARIIFNVSTFGTGATSKLKKVLSNIYFATEGFKEVVGTLNAEQVEQEYKNAEANLKRFRHYFSELEDINFFNSKDVRTFAEGALSNLYFIESRLRHAAFADTPTDEADKELKEISSIISRKSVLE